MEHKLRLAPGMSIQTGAEYTYAPPSRRGEILRHWVDGTKGFGSVYPLLEQRLHIVAQSGLLDFGRLSEMRSWVDSTRLKSERKAIAHQAIDAAVRSGARVTLPSGVRLVSWNERNLIQPIADVSLRARPFALLVNEANHQVSGAMMVRFKKQPFVGRGGLLAADLLRRAVEARVGHEVVPAHCIVVDAFADEVFVAPTKTKRLRQECEDAMYDLLGAWQVRSAE
jgi:hypothetical protein